MLSLYWIFRRRAASRWPGASAASRSSPPAYMAFAHGSNDAQKTMGIITLALFSAGVIPRSSFRPGSSSCSATALSTGTAVGGWRIMKTMGQRVGEAGAGSRVCRRDDGRLDPARDRASSAMPVSTTQVISGAIMGVGASQGARAVRWGVARRILVAWILTFPGAGILGALAWVVLNALGAP